MNCQNCRTHITKDEIDITPSAARHLEECAECAKFAAGQANLLQLLSDLPRVDAPSNFNFRVKARLRNGPATPPKAGLWRHLLWLVPSACALALFPAFVFHSNLAPPPSYSSYKRAEPTVTSQKTVSTKTPVAEIKREMPETAKNSSESNVSPEIERVSQSAPPQTTRGEKAINPRQIPKTEAKREKLRSVDLGVDAVKPSIMPRGIPDLLNSKNNNAVNILRFFGVESRLENQVLRVVSVASDNRAAGLQKDDVIEKINDESPATIKNEAAQNLNLTVRRKEQTIKITIQP